MGHLNSFSASGGRNLNKNFPKKKQVGQQLSEKHKENQQSLKFLTDNVLLFTPAAFCGLRHLQISWKTNTKPSGK